MIEDAYRIKEIMNDGKWYTLNELRSRTGLKVMEKEQPFSNRRKTFNANRTQ